VFLKSGDPGEERESGQRTGNPVMVPPAGMEESYMPEKMAKLKMPREAAF